MYLLPLLVITALLVAPVKALGSGVDDGRWLQRLYQATNGAEWRRTDGGSGSCFGGWNLTLGANPCLLSAWNRVLCAANGRVSRVYLYNCNLRGTLPELESSNTGAMSQLLILYLYGNQINGTLPGSWLNMSNLQVAYLSNNQLTGGLPSSWVNSLSSLGTTGLQLDSNCIDVSGTPLAELRWWSNKSGSGAFLSQQFTNCSVMLCTSGRSFINGSCRSHVVVVVSRNATTTKSTFTTSTTFAVAVQSVSPSILLTTTKTISALESVNPTNVPSQSMSRLTTTRSQSNFIHTLTGRLESLSTSYSRTCSRSLSPRPLRPSLSDFRTSSALLSSSSPPLGVSMTFSSRSMKLKAPSRANRSGRSSTATRSATTTLESCDSLTHCRPWTNRNTFSADTTMILSAAGGGGAEGWVMSSVAAADVRNVFFSQRSIESSPLPVVAFSIVCGGALTTTEISLHGFVDASHSATYVAPLGSLSTADIWTAEMRINTVATGRIDASATGTLTLLTSQVDSMGRAMTVPSFWYQSGLRLVIRFNLRCGGFSEPVSMTVPIVADGLPASTVSAAVASTAQWTAGLLSGASAAVVVGRVAATRRLVLCGAAASSVNGGLLGLRVGGGVLECEWLPLARGAIVGNVVVVLIGSLLLLLVGRLWASQHSDRPSIARRVCLPGSLLGLWTATLASTSAAVVVLMFPPSLTCELESADTIMVMAGVASAVVPLVMLGVVGAVGPEVVFGTTLSSSTTSSRKAMHCDIGLMGRMWRSVTRRRWYWVPDCPTENRLHWSQRMAGTLLLEYRVVWYATVDVGVLIVLSCISALSGSLRSDVCSGLSTAIVVVEAVQLVLCAALQPFTTRFSYAYGCVTLLIALICASMQLLAVSRLSSSDTSALHAVMIGVAACDLMSTVLSIVRLLVEDCPTALKGAVNLFRDMFAAGVATQDSAVLAAATKWEMPIGLERLLKQQSQNPVAATTMELLLVADDDVDGAVSRRRREDVDDDDDHDLSTVTSTGAFHGQKVERRSDAVSDSARLDDWVGINDVAYYMMAA